MNFQANKNDPDTNKGRDTICTAKKRKERFIAPIAEINESCISLFQGFASEIIVFVHIIILSNFLLAFLHVVLIKHGMRLLNV
jgi:hypothetical protein